MKIGLMNRPWKGLFDEIDWIGGQQFDFVDLTLGPPAADPEEVDADALKTALADRNLGVGVHQPWKNCDSACDWLGRSGPQH